MDLFRGSVNKDFVENGRPSRHESQTHGTHYPYQDTGAVCSL